MKRFSVVVALIATLFAIAGCAASKPSSAATKPSSEISGTVAPGRSETNFTMIGKTKLFLDGGLVYNPANFKYAAMDGEPSQIQMFKPDHPEGVSMDAKEFVYPKFDAKTFKFLCLSASNVTPQRYYMFEKDGGTLNKAVKGTGYKFASIYDSGDNKINANMYLGYYDFAWVTTGRATETWSGFISRNAELFKTGDNYVVIGASHDDGDALWAPAGITSLKQLDGKSVGIMNPNYQTEAAFNELLRKEGLATESGGGTVKVSMAGPAPIMNDLFSGKLDASFARGTFKKSLEANGFHELANTSDAWSGKSPNVVLIVRRDILEKHPDIVQAVVQANYDATQKAKADSEWETVEKDLLNKFRLVYDGKESPLPRNPKKAQLDAQANPDYMHGVYDFMKAAGFFKTPYAFERLVDYSFYNKVKK
jgi:ABC-type nitrate/sulfonate/bicarbonate transport system substrate-binding protein